MVKELRSKEVST